MIEEILSRLGYSLNSENAKFWRARPIYRESNNNTSLRINKETGFFSDFSSGKRGNLHELIRITLGLKSIKEVKKWTEDQEIEIEINHKKPKIVLAKIFKEKDVFPLLPHYSFYTGEPRNIDEKVLKELECGVRMSGKQNNRFVFVIRDEDKNIIGLAGRDLLNRDSKWKLMGRKTNWIFPLKGIEESEKIGSIILVESIGDMLALWNAGIKNVIVLFGLIVSKKVINAICSSNIKKIIISTNNDKDKKENSGMNAAEQIRKTLGLLFDEEKIEIRLPENGDIGDMKKEQIIKYFS